MDEETKETVGTAEIIPEVLKKAKCVNCYEDVYLDEAFTVRTSGKAKLYCRKCAETLEKRLRHSGTDYIVTPYVSVHAANVIANV